VKKEWIFPKTKTIEFLQKDKSLWRFMTVDRRVFPPNFSIVYHFPTIEGYDPLYLKKYAELITEIETGQAKDIMVFNRIIRPGNFSSELIDKLNVKYILSLSELNSPKLKKVFQEGETRVYENLKVRPRVVLSQGMLKVSSYQPGYIVLKVKTASLAELIISEMYYPGWQAKIDNQVIKITPTPENFLSLKIPPGEHKVTCWFSPREFKLGLLLTTIGIMITVGGWVLILFLKQEKGNMANFYPK
jgi:uncharacterized membrane protein YfhO